MSKNYFIASGSNLMMAAEAKAKAETEAKISQFLPRDKDTNDKLRAAARSAFGSERGQGTLGYIKNGCNDGSPLDKLNKGTEVDDMFSGMTQDKFNGLKQNVRLFYDSDRLKKKKWIQNILNAKVGKSTAQGHNHNLFTFTAESRLFLGSNGLPKDSTTPFTALNFTYLKFNDVAKGGAKKHFSENNLKNYAKENTKRMIALNMKAVAHNSVEQGLENGLPFILNPPGAFASRLSTCQQENLAQSITDSFIEAVNKVDVAKISEVIVLKGGGRGKDGGFFTEAQLNIMKAACKEKALVMHGGVDADMVSIAENFYKKTGKPCPIPIMGEPLGGVGNGALSNSCNKAVDEFLYRAALGLHGITASCTHNPNHFNVDKALAVPFGQTSVSVGTSPVPIPAPGKPGGTHVLEGVEKSKKIAEYLIKGQLEEKEEKAIEKYQQDKARPDLYFGFGFEYDLEVIDFMQEDGTTKKFFALKVTKIGNPSRLPDDIKKGNEITHIGDDSIHKIAMEAIDKTENVAADLSKITIEQYNSLKNAVMNHVREMATKEGDVNISRYGGESAIAKSLSGKKSLVFADGDDLSNISQINDTDKAAAQAKLIKAVVKLPSETRDALIESARALDADYKAPAL
ncbi:hypothetical protein N9O56_00900 [Rickettsiales bacterium]|nr:hypothetical protein [Rickettsiales bacterium]